MMMNVELMLCNVPGQPKKSVGTACWSFRSSTLDFY